MSQFSLMKTKMTPEIIPRMPINNPRLKLDLVDVFSIGLKFRRTKHKMVAKVLDDFTNYSNLKLSIGSRLDAFTAG